MKLRRGGWILVSALATFGAVSLPAIESKDLRVGAEYDMVLEDGQQLTRAVVMDSSMDTISVEMKGLRKRVTIPLIAVRSAKLVEKRKLIKRVDIGVFGDFQYSLGDLRLLTPYFPGAAIAINAELGKKMPFLRFDAVNAELDFAHISDGERRIIAGGLAFSPRWYGHFLKMDWLAGLGAGATLLRLKAFTFERWSYVALTFIEAGAFHDWNNRLRIYFLVRGNYLLDSRSPLPSAAARLGFSYRF